MHIIIGGAYQGKLDYARRLFSLEDNEICNLRTCDPDPTKRCYYHLEAYVLRCLKEDLDPSRILDALPPDGILIADDISAGIVPMDPTQRAWREASGRLLNTLSSRAQHVTRIFCGLPLELK